MQQLLQRGLSSPPPGGEGGGGAGGGAGAGGGGAGAPLGAQSVGQSFGSLEEVLHIPSPQELVGGGVGVAVGVTQVVPWHVCPAWHGHIVQLAAFGHPALH